jgi:hypothetical protein
MVWAKPAGGAVWVVAGGVVPGAAVGGALAAGVCAAKETARRNGREARRCRFIARKDIAPT